MREVISSRGGSALLAKRSLNGPPSLSHSVPLEIQRNLDYVWAGDPFGLTTEKKFNVTSHLHTGKFKLRIMRARQR